LINPNHISGIAMLMTPSSAGAGALWLFARTNGNRHGAGDRVMPISVGWVENPGMTSSIVARDRQARMYGVAVHSMFVAIGRLTLWARADAGATQAWISTAYVAGAGPAR
jgi:hypothetical protein